MSDTKHTPGPWNLEGWMVVASDAEASYICEVYPWSANPGYEMEAKQNAHLIAAAPELLEAAQTVLAGLNARIDAARGTGVPIFLGIAALHAAIAKALGS